MCRKTRNLKNASIDIFGLLILSKKDFGKELNESTLELCRYF